MYNLDLHIHSIYSRDSVLKPEQIIRTSKKKGLSGIAITDHNTITGAIKAKSFETDNFIVIPGSEITTDRGDVIGLFLNENIKPGSFFDVIDEINHQGGISILPHPYKNKLADPVELIEYVDIIEVMNARISKKLNYKANTLSKKFEKRIVGGSDAHTSLEIGRVQSILTDEKCFCDCEELKKYLLKGNINIFGNESLFHIRMLSTVIGKYNSVGITGLVKAGYHKALLR